MFITPPFWTIPMIRQGSDFPVVWAVWPAWTPCSGEHPACRYAPQPLQVRPQSLPTYPSGPAPVHTALGRLWASSQKLICPQLLLEGRLCSWLRHDGHCPGPGHGLWPWATVLCLGAEPKPKGSVDWTQPGPTQEPRLLCWDLFHHSGRCCQASLPPT